MISSLAALQVFNEIFTLTGGLGGHSEQRCNHGVLPLAQGIPAEPCRHGLGDRHGAAGDYAGFFDDQHSPPRTWHGGRVMASLMTKAARHCPHRVMTCASARLLKTFFWYIVLCLLAVMTVFPFVWVFFTSFKGPTDPIVSVPPQLIPHDPTFGQLSAGLEPAAGLAIFLQQHPCNFQCRGLEHAVLRTGGLSVGKDEIPGARPDLFLAAGHFIVPPELTSIPSFVLAVKVFHYYDKLRSRDLPQPGHVCSTSFCCGRHSRACPTI